MNKNTTAILLVCLLINLTACSTVVSKVGGNKPVGTDSTQRSFGRIVDDQIIETYVGANILKADEDFQSSNVVVTSLNGLVLLVGQVPSEKLRHLAGQTAEKVRNVRRVHNEITVSAPISLPARTSDAWLTTKIKSRMIGTEGVNPLQIKVVVENGVVYLMGMVTREEAEQAVNLAQQAYGVQKIVKVFEYL